MVSFFRMKLGGDKRRPDEDSPRSLSSPDDTFLGPSLSSQADIHDIRNIALPPLPRPDARPGSAASHRSPSATPTSPVDANASKHPFGSAPAARNHGDGSASSVSRVATPTESPVGSRPGTATGRYKAFAPPESQLGRDHLGPKSPLVQSQRVEAYVLGEPSPVMNYQPETAIIVSPMSSEFTIEEHSPVQDVPPSPPGSFAEFRKPEAEEPRSTRRGAHRGPPLIVTTSTAGNPDARQVPRPAPLPSPAPSVPGPHDGDGPDEDPWGIPVIKTVQAHRDALTVVAPRQLSISTNIVTSVRSPLAEFRFNDDDAEVLASARRTSSPIGFAEMSCDHKPLPLMLQRPAARIPENGVPSPLASPRAGGRSDTAPTNRAPSPLLQDGGASPLASPPQDRAAAGLGICGNWPLGDGILPSSSPEPSPRRTDPAAGPPGQEMVQSPLGDLGGLGGTRGPTPDNRGPPGELTSPDGDREVVSEDGASPVMGDPTSGRGPVHQNEGPSGEQTSASRARGPVLGNRGPAGEPTGPDADRGLLSENRDQPVSSDPMSTRGPVLEKNVPPGGPRCAEVVRGPTPENRGQLGGRGRPNGTQDPTLDNRRVGGPNGVHRPMYDSGEPPGGQGGPGETHTPAPEKPEPPGGVGAPNWPVRGPSLENRGTRGEHRGPNAARGGPVPGMKRPPGGAGGPTAPAYGPRLDSRGPPAGMAGSGAARGPMFENRGPPVQQDSRGLPLDGMRRPGPAEQGHMGRGYPRPGPANMRGGPPSGPPPGPPPGYHPGPPPRHQPGLPHGHRPGPQFGPHTGPPSGPPSRNQPVPPPGYRHGASSGAHSGPRHPHFRNQGPPLHRGPLGPAQPLMNGTGLASGHGRGSTAAGGPAPSPYQPGPQPGPHDAGDPLLPAPVDLRTRNGPPGSTGPRNAGPRGPPPSAPPPPLRAPLPPQALEGLGTENPAQSQPQPHPPNLSIQPADSDLRFDFPVAPAAPTSPNPDPSGGVPASKWTTPRPAPPSPAQLANKSPQMDSPNWPFVAAAPITSQPVAPLSPRADQSPGRVTPGGGEPDVAVLRPPPRNPLRTGSPMGRVAPRGPAAGGAHEYGAAYI